VTGALDPGLAADLVVMDADLEVRAVMIGGSWTSQRGFPPQRSVV
jgi:N-acetylglucosamine-6-phosphate deacetylase